MSNRLNVYIVQIGNQYYYICHIEHINKHQKQTQNPLKCKKYKQNTFQLICIFQNKKNKFMS